LRIPRKRYNPKANSESLAPSNTNHHRNAKENLYRLTLDLNAPKKERTIWKRIATCIKWEPNRESNGLLRYPNKASRTKKINILK
jgi:hypothetical protein